MCACGDISWRHMQARRTHASLRASAHQIEDLKKAKVLNSENFFSFRVPSEVVIQEYAEKAGRYMDLETLPGDPSLPRAVASSCLNQVDVQHYQLDLQAQTESKAVALNPKPTKL